ncbi:PREDICTED: zinc finger protein 36, C3H1 type-like 3 [Rhinopithecus bieti]|uniref:zinc finger protein 36, C3H1 type-like 3 n=1 Tax=Rhinopithecus bieti TaxID=61621 RepID=UPI00083C7CE6|nr:PREDICTED: zinc finger protein 36, C3H1 type-like 3 [Rhinopithecus bieti]
MALGLQFYLAVPRNQWRSQRRKDHPRAPRLPASSQQVSCRPASGSRPPPGSASAHKALGAPRAARASGSPAAGPSPALRPPASSLAGRAPSAPSHTRAALPMTQPGIGARGPWRPGRVGAGGTARRPHRGARLPAPARVRLPRALSVRLVRGFRGPLRWGLAPPRGK